MWYWSQLVALHGRMERGLVWLYENYALPAGEALAVRFPLLRRVASPLVYSYGAASNAVAKCYNLVHDSLVPTALEIADKIPGFEAVFSGLVPPLPPAQSGGGATAAAATTAVGTPPAGPMTSAAPRHLHRTKQH